MRSAAAAASTLRSPPTLTSSKSSRRRRQMLTSAAECEIASQPAAARSSAARSRMSPSIARAGQAAAAGAAREDHEIVPARRQRAHDGAAEIPGAARHQHFHGVLRAPVLEQIVERLLDRNLRASSRARRAGGPGRRAGAACRSGGSAPDRPSPSTGTRARAISTIEQLADGDRAARADVVGTARLSALENQLVGAHRVAHVGEIAPRVEIADRDLRRPASRSMSAMRRAKPEATKYGSCRGPKWLNGRAIVTAMPPFVFTPSISCASLLNAVRARREQRMILGQRLVRRRVDQRRARHQDARVDAGALERLQQMMRAAHVGREASARSSPRRARRAPRRRSGTRRPAARGRSPPAPAAVEQIDRLPPHAGALARRRAAGPMPGDHARRRRRRADRPDGCRRTRRRR